MSRTQGEYLLDKEKVIEPTGNSDIEELVRYINSCSCFSNPVKIVLAHRLLKKPTNDEFLQAYQVLNELNKRTTKNWEQCSTSK